MSKKLALNPSPRHERIRMASRSGGSDRPGMWWYEDRKFISIFVAQGGVVSLTRISRAKLVDWIKRTEPRTR